MKTLIRTIEEFSLYVGVASSYSLDKIMGDILLVEDEHLRKYLGEEFHDHFLERYEAGGLTAHEEKLLSYLQQAVANLAMESFLILNQVDITEIGIQIHSDETTKTAFQWQINELKKSLLKKGYAGLEKALQYLIKHVDHGDFAIWKESGILTQFRRNFINTAREFSEHYSIRNSWLTFLGLQPIIRKIELTKIFPQLGEDLAQEIIDQVKSGQVSANNETLLRAYIRPALAHLTVAKALVEQGFELTPDGIEITYARIDDGNSKEAEADNSSLLKLKIQEAERDGQYFLGKMRKFLDRNASATQFPAYFNSDRYTPPAAPVSMNQTTSRTYKTF